MGGEVWWAELVELRGANPAIVKNFNRAYMDDCAGAGQGSQMFGTLIFYTPAAPDAFPSGFRQDVYRSTCDDSPNWKYATNGKVPAI